MTIGQVKYKTSDEVDFVIIGSGAAGGVMAKELSTNAFRVVVLEQGPYLKESDFVHDEVRILQENLLTNIPNSSPAPFVRLRRKRRSRNAFSPMGDVLVAAACTSPPTTGAFMKLILSSEARSVPSQERAWPIGRSRMPT